MASTTTKVPNQDTRKEKGTCVKGFTVSRYTVTEGLGTDVESREMTRSLSVSVVGPSVEMDL